MESAHGLTPGKVTVQDYPGLPGWCLQPEGNVVLVGLPPQTLRTRRHF
jgi:hypothetical protein